MIVVALLIFLTIHCKMIIKRKNIAGFFFLLIAAGILFKELLKDFLELIRTMFGAVFDFKGGVEKILEIGVLVLVKVIVVSTEKIVKVPLVSVRKHLVGLVDFVEALRVF